MNRFVLSRRGLVTAALAAPAILGSRARAAGTIQMISHRYPALEYYAGKMRDAIPGVTVNTQLMPFDKALELITIALSSKADTPDIVYCNDTTMQTMVKRYPGLRDPAAFESFKRKWRYLFAYAGAGFAKGYISCHMLTFYKVRPNSQLSG